MYGDFTVINGINLTIAVVGLAVALAATAVGVLNHGRLIDQDKVKLRVVPHCALSEEMPDREFLALTITNLSVFPITLKEVGILFDERKQRAISVHAVASDGGPVTRRMDPRTSVGICFPPEFLRDPRFQTAECAYATTDCGETVESIGPALKEMVAEAQRPN